MRKLLFVLALLLICLAWQSVEAANVVRAFTCLSGGTTGCVDKIAIADIADGDIGIAVTGNTAYIYQFNAASTQAESSPTYIRPDDYATAGVWHLVTMRAVASDTGRATTPCVSFYDADATDSDVNGKLCLQCTATGSGAEDCYLYAETQRAGVSTEQAQIGNGIGLTAPLKVLPISASCTVGSDCDGTSVQLAYGGAVLATAAITVTLPEIVSSPSATQVRIGASICVIARDAGEALVIDPHANDSITLDGTKDTAGNNITATGAGAFACLLAVEADNWMVMGTSGSWSAE